MELIKQHGKYSQFLEFFDYVTLSEGVVNDNHELYKSVMMTFLNKDYFEFINVY